MNDMKNTKFTNKFLGGSQKDGYIYIYIYIYIIYIYLYTMCFLGWSVFQSEKDGPGS